MYSDRQRSNPFGRISGGSAEPLSLWKKIVAVAAAGGVFVLALMFSVVLFAVVLTVGAAVWGWLWWNTRAVRKQMREQRARRPDTRSGTVVIEGEVIREVRDEDEPRR